MARPPARSPDSRAPSREPTPPLDTSIRGSNKAYARELYRVTLKLYDHQYNVVPVDQDKKPLTKWGPDKRVPLEELKRLLPKATGIAIVAGPENYWGDIGDYLVIIDVDNPSILDKSPKLREIVESTVAWKTGPRCPKPECGSKHLEVLEPGRRFKCKCGLEFTVEEAARGLGALVLVSGELVRKYLGGSTQRLGSVELMVNNYQLVPPSLHPTGVRYEWIKPLDLSLPNHGLLALEEEDLRQLLEELRPRTKLEEHVEAKAGAKARVEEGAQRLRELQEHEILEIVDALQPAYVPGVRQHIWLFLSGWAAKAGVSPVSVARVLKALYDKTGDTDSIRTRASAIAYSYRKAGVSLEPYAKALEELLGVKPYGLEGEIREEEIKGRSGLQEILEQVMGEERAVDVIGLVKEKFGVASLFKEDSVDSPPVELHDRVNWLKDKILEFVNPQEFEDLNTRRKIKIVFEIISKYFEFIRLPALDINEDPEVYALDGDVLIPVENVLAPIVGTLVKAGLIRKSIMGDLELAAHSTSWITSWRELNPWDKIRLKNGVLDLRELKLLDKTRYYFTYRLDIEITEGELKEIRDGSYKVEDNPVYKSWRVHFEDVDWDYLVDSLGTWLAPFRFKHIAFLIGPRNSGKSTLLINLTEPINPLIARSSLRDIVNNRFGLQPLIGKQVLVHSERGDVVLKNLDIVNNLVGESDYIPVDRKHLPIVNIRSLKAAMFSMNDPPILYEQGGETLAAFLDRLSIIFMRAPEGFKPVKNYRVDPKEVFKFLLWCRVQLENRGWEIRTRDFEEKLDYLNKMSNTALRFLESDYIIKDPYGRVKGTELYEAYKKWCMEQGLPAMGRNDFYAAVATQYTDYRPEGSVWFRGLRLKKEREHKQGLGAYQ